MRHSIRLALFTLVALGALTLPASLGAQTATKIGVINTNQVLAESAAGVAAGNAFSAYATEQQQPLLDLEAEINVKAQQLETQRLALSQQALATRTAELDRLQRNFTRGQEDLAADLQAKEAEVLQPVYDLANEVIDQFATEMGYQLIIDPTAAQGLLVYMDESADVTLEIISRMDAASAAASSAAPAGAGAPATGQ